MASNFKYKGSDFSVIYASNPNDFYYGKQIPDYFTQNNLNPYNQTNGSTSQQTDIPYTYEINSISYNYSYGVQAYYKEYTTPGSTTINGDIPNCCTKLRVFACGAGGSGGAGGGDKKGYKGTNGAGGGGGAYGYVEIDLTSSGSVTWQVFVGTGGGSVSGGNPGSGDSNNGMPGNPGTSSGIKYLLTSPSLVVTIMDAAGGGGGDGGHPTSGATPGQGGTSVTGSNTIKIDSGNDSSGMDGGLSGYGVFGSGSDFGTYFKPITGTSYGNGGFGTSGGYDPNNSPTGEGQNGYVRVYFII